MAGFAFSVVASGIAAATLAALNTRAEVDAWTEQKSEVVESVVQDLLDDVFDDLEAMAGYIEHGDPSATSFGAFSNRIDGTANAIGVGYVASVTAAQVDAHIAERRAVLGDFYDILGLSPESALPVPFDRSGRTIFYPVQLFAAGDLIQPLLTDDTPPSELGLGVDGGYTPEWRGLIGTAMAADGRNLSSFFSIEAEGFRFDRLFFASVPVRSRDGRTTGLVISVMLEPLLLNNVDTNILGDVQWEVVPIGGEPERIDSEEIRFFSLDIPNTPWRLAVAPTEEALAELTGRPAWMNGLLVSLAAALVALSLWLLIDRRAQRNRAAALRTSVSRERPLPCHGISRTPNAADCGRRRRQRDSGPPSRLHRGRTRQSAFDDRRRDG